MRPGRIAIRLWQGLAIAALAALVAVRAGAAAPTTYRLDNGLELVVIEDHRAPVVVHMVWYRTGAADERPGKSGIAHFFEHLMFKATDELQPGEFSRIVELNGGTDNAFTTWDYTAYFQRVAADRLGLMMKMEADRMRDLRLSDDVVLTERSVILEERNQRVDGDPGALFSEQRRAAQFLNHPYGIPVIGWRHEIAALTADDARAFYRRYYAPNNAIVVVAGDVDPARVRELAERHYGPLAPSKDIPPRLRPQEPPQLAERRLVSIDERVAQPYLVRTYLAPERDPGNQREAAALTILSALLGGNGLTSVLGEALQLERKLAIHVSAGYDGTAVDDTTFSIVAVPAPGVTLESLESAMDETLARFLERGIDAERFSRVKTQVTAGEIYERDSLQALAHRYGAGLAVGLSLEDIEAWPDILHSVTADEVLAAARRLLDRRHAVTGFLAGRPEEVRQ
ncbi:MAG: insulinase family protein [Alphaproteobacteria bacterium]|nr:MAG: insulinase family protein [Alphaproteobacteria bacterium]